MSDDENANPNSGPGVGAPLRTILGLFFLFLVIGMCLPRLSTPRAHTEKSFCQSNMRNAVLAILNYEALNQAYPQAVSYDATGQVARSWRVEVLPQYSQQAVRVATTIVCLGMILSILRLQKFNCRSFSAQLLDMIPRDQNISQPATF